MKDKLKSRINSISNLKSTSHEVYRFFVVAYFGSLIGLIAHILFVFIFMLLKIKVLAIYNMASLIIWLTAFRLNKKGQHRATLYLASSELIVHAVLAVCYLGWNSGFHYYILCLIPFIFLFPSSRISVKLTASTLMLLIYTGLNIYSHYALPLTQLSSSEINGLNIMNICGTFIIFSYFAYFHSLVYNKTEQELKRLNHRLEILAGTDYLTGLYNRRRMIEKINLQLLESRKNNRPFTVIISDIDDFKDFNDKYGHDCGDFVLKEISSIFTCLLGKAGYISRWGGEEFLILLPDTDLEYGKIIAEHIREKISGTRLIYNSVPISFSMTFGISLCKHSYDIARCIKSADKALYVGKKSGKNRVVSMDEVV